MSRSYRKPYYTQGYGGSYKKIAKRSANKAARKSKDLSSNCGYKKEFNSWDITDYIFYAPDDSKAYRK